MTINNSFIQATAVAAVVFAGMWQPGADAWGADGKEEPWYTAWLQVTADTDVSIRDTKPSLHWRTDMDTLYRGDTTGQGLDAFQNGILPKAVGFPVPEWMYDWWSHGAGAAKSVYSSTTRDQDLAQRFAKEWVYEIKAPHGIDQDASGGCCQRAGDQLSGGSQARVRQASMQERQPCRL
ncbi:hypothetical protein [Pseudomonas sp. R3-41]